MKWGNGFGSGLQAKAAQAAVALQNIKAQNAEALFNSTYESKIFYKLTVKLHLSSCNTWPCVIKCWGLVRYRGHLCFISETCYAHVPIYSMMHSIRTVSLIKRLSRLCKYVTLLNWQLNWKRQIIVLNYDNNSACDKQTWQIRNLLLSHANTNAYLLKYHCVRETQADREKVGETWVLPTLCPPESVGMSRTWKVQQAVMLFCSAGINNGSFSPPPLSFFKWEVKFRVLCNK